MPLFTIADRVTVLRDGRNVGERAIARITRNEMIELMVGRELKDEFPARTAAIGAPRLQVFTKFRFTTQRGNRLKARLSAVVSLCRQ